MPYPLLVNCEEYIIGITTCQAWFGKFFGKKTRGSFQLLGASCRLNGVLGQNPCHGRVSLYIGRMAIVLALIIAGAVLLFLETILPGLVAGILGGICLMAAVVIGYTQFGYDGGTWILAGVGLLLTTAGVAYLKYFPKTRVAKRFISQGTIGAVAADRADLLGRSGVAHTTLRPSGKALIDGRQIDVVTEGPFIERGQSIKVIAVEGARVVVRAV